MRLSYRFALPALALLLLCLLPAGPAQAQAFGYIDSELILTNMPEYKTVQAELDKLAESWELELNKKYEKIEAAYQDYRAREVLLSQEDRQKAQDNIMKMEQEAKEFQQAKFGYEGELFSTRQEKLRPIRKKLFDAVAQVAQEKRVNMIMDKSGATTIIYSDPRFDYTTDVMTKVGVDPNVVKLPGQGTGEDE